MWRYVEDRYQGGTDIGFDVEDVEWYAVEIMALLRHGSIHGGKQNMKSVTFANSVWN